MPALNGAFPAAQKIVFLGCKPKRGQGGVCLDTAVRVENIALDRTHIIGAVRSLNMPVVSQDDVTIRAAGQEIVALRASQDDIIPAVAIDGLDAAVFVKGGGQPVEG